MSTFFDSLSAARMAPLQPQFLAVLLALGSVFAGLAAHALALGIVRRVARGLSEPFWGQALETARRPTRLLAALLALELFRVGQDLSLASHALVQKLLALCWIGALAWSMSALGAMLALWLQRSCDIRSEDNLHARKILTQIRLFRRVFAVLVVLVALATALMVFDATRGIGASVLASAGIAGAVAGLSAQKFLATIFAGMQIAITQPIRLDDVVVVEGEWGRVEEITLTYVVVRIWDERRLVVPVTHFLDKPVQNWTRSNSELMGSVFLSVDYRASVADLRTELERICREEAGGLWDGRVCGLQVTEAGPATLTLRALVSSADSSRNWDLRCLVRERLVCYVQKKHPEALPLTRVSLGETELRTARGTDNG